MRKTMRAGLMVLMLMSSSLSVVQAEENIEQTTRSVSVMQPQAMNVDTLVNRIAIGSEFADWQNATVLPLRSLETPTGGGALLWQVQQSGQEVGYLVTSSSGDRIYEASKRAAPMLPETMSGQALRYVYGGPMLHVAEVLGVTGPQFYHLMTGEMMPLFGLGMNMPDGTSLAMVETSPAYRETEVAMSRLPEDDALYASGLYGGQQARGERGLSSLSTYTDNTVFAQPAFVVYEAAPGLQASLAVRQLLFYGEQRFVGLSNPFEAQGKPPVYIDSRFPVDVISLHVDSQR